MKSKIVVIGNGMAGARVVEEILKRAAGQFEIVMFGAERYGNYNRILLSNVLNQTQNPTEIFINPLSWYQENNIKLYSGVKAVRIDRHLKKVFAVKLSPEIPAYAQSPADEAAIGPLDIGESYDHVIIATGSRPFVPPLSGFGAVGTFLFRTLDDGNQIAR